MLPTMRCWSSSLYELWYACAHIAESARRHRGKQDPAAAYGHVDSRLSVVRCGVVPAAGRGDGRSVSWFGLVPGESGPAAKPSPAPAEARPARACPQLLCSQPRFRHLPIRIRPSSYLCQIKPNERFHPPAPCRVLPSEGCSPHFVGPHLHRPNTLNRTQLSCRLPHYALSKFQGQGTHFLGAGQARG